MSDRNGTFMLTASGRRFWPLDPRADEVDLWDIAQALANQGRYNGHTRHFYSVAQHCVELARWFLKQGNVDHARWACVHDAAEAYTGDMIRPLKPHFPEFIEVERKVERLVFDALGMRGELPKAVHDADKLIVRDEQLVLFPLEAIQREGIDKKARLGIEIRALMPNVARDRWLALHHELFVARAA